MFFFIRTLQSPKYRLRSDIVEMKQNNTVDLGYCVTQGTREICMLYPKIRYKAFIKGGNLVLNEPLGTCYLVRYIRQNAISKVLISEVHCIHYIYSDLIYSQLFKEEACIHSLP